MAEKILTTVSFPTKLLQEVDNVVSESGKYMSRADFCRAAVRRLISEEGCV